MDVVLKLALKKYVYFKKSINAIGMELALDMIKLIKNVIILRTLVSKFVHQY